MFQYNLKNSINQTEGGIGDFLFCPSALRICLMNYRIKVMISLSNICWPLGRAEISVPRYPGCGKSIEFQKLRAHNDPQKISILWKMKSLNSDSSFVFPRSNLVVANYIWGRFPIFNFWNWVSITISVRVSTPHS